MPRPTLSELNDLVLSRHGYAIASNSPMAAGLSLPKSQPARGPALVEAAQDESGSAFGFAPSHRVSFTLKRVHLLDKDNSYSAVKYCLDALRHEGLIPDDTNDDIDLNVRQEKVDHFHDEGTAILIQKLK
jgi:hypothetical protein